MQKETLMQGEFLKHVGGLRTCVAAAFLVLAGSLFSILFFIEGRQLEHQRMKTHFTEAAQARISLLEKELEIHGEHIESIAAFYDGSVKVERAEFGKFVAGPLSKHPDAVAFLWILRVTAAQRDEYEKLAIKDGLADFQINELDSSGRHIPASLRKIYLPIYFLEPYEGNELLAGFDLATIPSLLETLDHARRTGTLATSEQFRLSSQVNNKSVYLRAMPVYAKNASGQTIEPRDRQIAGYVAGVYRHELTLGRAEKTLEPAAIDIYIYDNSVPEEERLVYYHPSNMAGGPVKDYRAGETEVAEGLYLDRMISMGHRQWLIRCVACSEYLASAHTWQPWASLFIGLLFTSLAAKYVLDKGSETEKLEKLVDAKTTQLHESELIFGDFFKNAPVGFHVFGPDRLIIDINQAELDMLGFTREEILNRKTWGDLIIPEQRKEFERHWAKIISKGHVRNMEYTLIRKDGSTVDVLLNASARISKSGELINTRGSVLDITERKQDETERELLLKTLASKNEELESIVFISSHDLRSPLVNIQGFSSELSLSCKQIKSIVDRSKLADEEKEEIYAILNDDIVMELEYIINSTARMNMLLAGLLKLSRLGQAAMEISALDMNNLLAEILGDMHYQINEKDIKLNVGILPKCYGDQSQINQVFTNLLSNAVKYLGQNRRGEISISGQREGDRCVYCIRDNGIGIAEAHQNKIFEVFHRLNPNEPTEGEGLGLTIVKRIVDRHNGKIWIESQVGNYCCFYVELPAKAFVVPRKA
jgi:PAS domain S-box-containing protein